MSETYKITFQIKSVHYKKLEEMTSILIKRGLMGSRNKSTIKEMILNEALSYITPDCFDEILEKITPLEFLYKEGLKDPLIKEQMEKLLRKNKKGQDRKPISKKPYPSVRRKV